MGGGERLNDLHMATAMTWEFCFAMSLAKDAGYQSTDSLSK